MINVEIVLGDFRWKNKIKNPNLYIRKKILKFNKLKLLKNKSNNYTIFLTNNKKMKELNKKFRKKNKPTDVLSFPFENKLKNKKNIYLGDIAISYEFVNKRSKNSDLFFEFDKLWIHGYLHLLGYNHKRNKDYYKMKKLEDLILNRY
tara:strand:- start:256 stop:696 length:441 start_codon:yes stop_codon:yes gene_type:complete